jgi:hypothetical protein
MVGVPRPVSDASIRVLSRVARYGIHYWVPGFLAVLGDPWRSRVHIGSVGSLISAGLIEVAGEFEAAITPAGQSTLERCVLNETGGVTRTIGTTSVRAAVAGLNDATISTRTAARVIDALRLIQNDQPSSWERFVDLALVGQEHPAMVELLQSVMDTTLPERELQSGVELELRFTPLAPSAR